MAMTLVERAVKELNGKEIGWQSLVNPRRPDGYIGGDIFEAFILIVPGKGFSIKPLEPENITGKKAVWILKPTDPRFCFWTCSEGEYKRYRAEIEYLLSTTKTPINSNCMWETKDVEPISYPDYTGGHGGCVLA